MEPPFILRSSINKKYITEFTNIDDAAFHISKHGLNHETIHLLLLDLFDEKTSRGFDEINNLLFKKEGYGAMSGL